MTDAPDLSVIIPSYNELHNLEEHDVLQQVVQYLEDQEYSWEVILSDDGSTDGTVKALQDFAEGDTRIRVLANRHAGKGPTVTAGMLAANGRWRLFTDFDQSTPLSEIEKLWPYSKKEYEIVIGSREIAGSVRDQEPWYRHVMGRGFNILVQSLAVPGIFDTQCGFKLFSEEATETLFRDLYVYGQAKERQDAYTGAFDVELLFLARKHGFHIAEVPILWYHRETDRVSPLKDSFRMLRDILRIRLASIMNKYHTE